MNKIIMLALAIAMLSGSVYSAEPQWNKWNVAPYANSIAEALKKASATIDSFKWEPEVKAHFDSLFANPQVLALADTVWLTPGMPLEQMMSGGRHPHVMNSLPVGELPVLKSPDGRSYPKGAVAETAAALSWSFASNDKTTVLCLPLVCFNFCWFFGPPPVPAPERCVELSFNVPVGGKVRWGFFGDSPLSPSACNAQRQGDEGSWLAWYGRCDDCIRTPAMGLFLRNILGDKAEIHHKYLYRVTERHQTLRFSTAVWTGVVYICLEYPDGTRTEGRYVIDWQKQYEVEIPDDSWAIAK